MKKAITMICLLMSQITLALDNHHIISYDDSTFATWRRNKTYDYSRLHGYISFGSPFEIKQTTGWSETKNMFPKNGFYSPFTINIVPKGSFKLGFGLDVNLSKRIKFGIALLPTHIFEYNGGKGTEVVQGGFLFLYTTWRRGIWMSQSIKNTMFNVNTSITLVPFKRKNKYGFELSLRTGMIFNKWTASTTLGAFDYTSTQNGSFGSTNYSNQVANSQTFTEVQSGIGFNASLDVHLYFGKYFSLFSQLMTGYTEELSLSEKKVTSGTQTAYLPQQSFNCSGIGLTIGVVFHFIHHPIVLPEPTVY